MDRTGISLEQSEKVSTPKIVWNCLTRHERIALGGILFLMLLGTVLETFSLGLVLPAVGMLTQPNYLQKYPSIDNFLGNPTEVQFVVGSMIFLVVVYILKTAFLIWSLWVQKGYSNSVSTRIGRQLFDTYLRQPYSFHLTRNSALLIRNSQNSGMLVSGAIDPMLTILSDVLVTVALFVLLVVLEPRGTIATVVVFGLSAWIFRQFTNKRIRRWGKAQNFHKGMILQHLQQGFGGGQGRQNSWSRRSLCRAILRSSSRKCGGTSPIFDCPSTSAIWIGNSDDNGSRSFGNHDGWVQSRVDRHTPRTRTLCSGRISFIARSESSHQQSAVDECESTSSR